MRSDIAEFLKTVYLGDRGLKGIRLDTWDDRLALQVDCISRVRGETWNFYSDEDIDDGLIVFEAFSMWRSSRSVFGRTIT